MSAVVDRARVAANGLPNPEAAHAAYSRFAIPAQEQTKQQVEVTKQAEQVTKQAEEATKRFKYRTVAYPPVLAVGVLCMALTTNGSAEWIALALVGVLGTVEGVQFLDGWLSQKGK
jgi:hypothetical protein